MFFLDLASTDPLDERAGRSFSFRSRDMDYVEGV